MPSEVTSVDELRAIVGHPAAAAADKVTNRLSDAQRGWLSHSPLGFIATTDSAGRLDVSPKGDPPGFVHVVDGKRPILALEVAVDEVFFHCSKAFLRSDAWQPETWDPTAVPSIARLAKAIKPELSDEQLDAYYEDANLRKILY